MKKGGKGTGLTAEGLKGQDPGDGDSMKTRRR